MLASLLLPYLPVHKEQEDVSRKQYTGAPTSPRSQGIERCQQEQYTGYVRISLFTNVSRGGTRHHLVYKVSQDVSIKQHIGALTSPCQTTRSNVWPMAVHAVTHQTLRQQRGTGEDSYIHLADWTLSVAAIEKKEKTLFTRNRVPSSTLFYPSSSELDCNSYSSALQSDPYLFCTPFFPVLLELRVPFILT